MSNGEGAQGSKVDSAAKDSSSDKASGSGKIFIGGLSWETSTEKLTNHFKKYGEIIDSVIMKDRVTGHARGFGFVTYSDPSVCERVIQEIHVLDGRMVEIKRSIPRDSMVKGPKTKKIFVGGIPPSITEDEFKNYFAKFGKIVEHQIMQDHSTGRSRGFGFVTFDSEQVVDEILSKGTMIELGGKQVEIKKAEPKKPTTESGPGYGPPSGKGGYTGDYRGYSDFGAYDGGAYGPYRTEGGRFGGRADGGYGRGYASGVYGGYGRSGYGGSGYDGGSQAAYGSSSFGGGYGSGLAYDGLGGGYGVGGYGDVDNYGSLSYGGYGSNSYGAGYAPSGAYGGGYGSGRYGSGSGSTGRYHPYGRN